MRRRGKENAFATKHRKFTTNGDAVSVGGRAVKEADTLIQHVRQGKVTAFFGWTGVAADKWTEVGRTPGIPPRRPVTLTAKIRLGACRVRQTAGQLDRQPAGFDHLIPLASSRQGQRINGELSRI